MRIKWLLWKCLWLMVHRAISVFCCFFTNDAVCYMNTQTIISRYHDIQTRTKTYNEAAAKLIRDVALICNQVTTATLKARPTLISIDFWKYHRVLWPIYRNHFIKIQSFNICLYREKKWINYPMILEIKTPRGACSYRLMILAILASSTPKWVTSRTVNGAFEATLWRYATFPRRERCQESLF